MSHKLSLSTFRRPFAGLACLAFGMLLTVGCQKPQAPEQTEEEQAVEQEANAPLQFSKEIHSLSTSDLNALGAKNDLPTEFVYPGAYFVQAVFPERLNSVEQGAVALEYFEQSSFQLPVKGLLAKSELAISSKGFSFELLKNAKTDEVLHDSYPTPFEVVYIRSKEALDKQAILDEVFKKANQSQVKDEKYGAYEAKVFTDTMLVQLDQSGQMIGKIDKICAGVCFPTDNSALFLSGTADAYTSFFAATPGDERGVAAQRIARTPIDSLAVVFQYDYDFEYPNTQLVQPPLPLTAELMQSIQKTVAAFQFSFDVSDPTDGNILTLTVNTKSADGADELRKAIGTALLKAVDSIKSTQEAQNNAEAAESAAPLINLLKTVNLKTDGNAVVGTLKNTPESVEFFAKALKNLNDLRTNSTLYAKYDVAAQMLDQFGRYFTSYFGKNKKFPAPICAEDGTPLLSWRVAMLPILGEQYQKLYDQFKLDEPWNSENNIKLLDQMPALYASPYDPVLKGKTNFQIFNSPETPFGRFPQGLTLKDVADPSRTFSVVLTAEPLAIEWTRPETLTYNPEKPSETFGDFVCAVTLMGEVVRSVCDDSEKTAKTLSGLIYGVEIEESADENNEEAKEAAPSAEQTTDADADAAESTSENSEEVEASAPEVEQPADAVPAESSPENSEPAE